MQLQHMRMLNQFQNGNLPFNLVRDGHKEEEGEGGEDAEAEHKSRSVHDVNT